MATSKQDESMSDAVHAVANAIQRLGNADACTPMGGLEALGAVHIGVGEKNSEAIVALAEAVTHSGNQIREGFRELAAAIRKEEYTERWTF